MPSLQRYNRPGDKDEASVDGVRKAYEQLKKAV